VASNGELDISWGDGAGARQVKSWATHSWRALAALITVPFAGMYACLFFTRAGPAVIHGGGIALWILGGIIAIVSVVLIVRDLATADSQTRQALGMVPSAP
jgi:hypothetical protein